MSAPGRCTGDPVSWLRLERYHLGAVDGAERERIDAHLATCEACAACFAKIRADEEVALPALVAPRPVARVRRLRPAVVFSSAVGALAAAAAVVLALRGSGPGDGGQTAVPGGSRVKGDAMGFTLVREDGVRIDGDAGVYREGDRLKALVTCAPGSGLSLDLVVYDAEGASFPLDPATDFACGNDTPMRGAFRLNGRGDQDVCVVWSSAGPVDRAALTPAAGAGGNRMCKKLAEGALPSAP
jgi:hypothetical protein